MFQLFGNFIWKKIIEYKLFRKRFRIFSSRKSWGISFFGKFSGDSFSARFEEKKYLNDFEILCSKYSLKWRFCSSDFYNKTSKQPKRSKYFFCLKTLLKDWWNEHFQASKISWTLYFWWFREFINWTKRKRLNFFSWK